MGAARTSEVPRILLVDDDEAWASLVTEAFKRVSSVDRLEIATDPETALDRVASTRDPFTVVLDLNLSGRDGIQLLRTIRQVAGARVSVLVMTSSAALKDQAAVEAMGAEFVTKPTSFAELCDVVRGLTASEPGRDA